MMLRMINLGSMRETLYIFVIVVLTGVASAFFLRAVPTIQGAENWVSDYRVAAFAPPRAQNSDIVVLAINEDSLATLPYRSPVDRGFLSNLLRILDSAGARAIGLDVLFDQPTEPDKDKELKKTLQELSAPLVVAFADEDEALTEAQAKFIKGYLEGINTGYANLVNDRVDGVVRWIFPGKKGRLGFAQALARALGKDVHDDAIRLDYHATPDVEKSAFRVYPAHAAHLLPKEWFKGKIILIGSDLPMTDHHRTPFAAAFGVKAGSLSGVIIHAHALAQLLEGRSLPKLSGFGEAGLVFLIICLGLLFAFLDFPLLVKLGGRVFLLVLLWGGGVAVYSLGGPLIPLVTPTLVFAITTGAAGAYIGRRDRAQKKFIRKAFSRYVSRSVVDRLIADPSQLKVSGERRELTYIFTDLANFTALTERTKPEVLVPLLNEYIDAMCAIAIKHGATLDKIIGDAVVAFFNAPVDQPDHHQLAVNCALEMDAFGQNFIARQKDNGLEIGITRIGVNSGVATIGNFGGELFFDYTSFGDMVNTAARLESANKHLGTRICIGGETASKCDTIVFRSIGDLVLKGKTEAISVFEPLSEEQAQSSEVAAYREAFDLLQKKDPAARAAFEKVVKMAANDGLAAFHLRRVEQGDTGATIVLEEK